MIIFSEILIIWWLFDDYSNYLIIWWLFWLFWLFDDYLPFCSGSFQCSFLSHCHLVIMLGLPTLWATNYRQLEARRRWRGRYWVVNRTLLRRLPLRRFCCGGTICLIPGHERRPAIRRNPPLLLVAEGLLWKLPAKMRKWSARDLKIVCRIHAFPQALSTTSRKDAWGALFTTPHWARRRTP